VTETDPTILPETVLQDLRYGARMLCRNAGFTAVAVFALALGIGINTAVFTAYQAMVVQPWIARDPGGMVDIALIRDSGAAALLFTGTLLKVQYPKPPKSFRRTLARHSVRSRPSR
jgi:hypothetical protein